MNSDPAWRCRMPRPLGGSGGAEGTEIVATFARQGRIERQNKRNSKSASALASRRAELFGSGFVISGGRNCGPRNNRALSLPHLTVSGGFEISGKGLGTCSGEEEGGSATP